MVNGGGSLMLEFSKNRLKTRFVSTSPLWNQFIHVDPIIMYLNEDPLELHNSSSCEPKNHSFLNINPKIYSNWNKIRSNYYDNSTMVLPSSGVLRSELNIPDSSLKLVYMSSLASGYSSSIFLLLTENEVPDSLQLIHLKIVVEGVLFKQTFDAYSNLKYEFSWDRRNAYEQRVYGFAYAKIMIGYQYDDCSEIFWKNNVVKLAGYDLGSSEIGNWNLNIHHRLNTQQGKSIFSY